MNAWSVCRSMAGRDGELFKRGAYTGFDDAAKFWEEKISHVKFNLPHSADPILNTYKANLVYILINRDKAGIQPGSRSYERSWIRDGALTSSALLKSGIVQEVKDFIACIPITFMKTAKSPAWWISAVLTRCRKTTAMVN